jgi:DNA-directed RNA polymerase specialized sigma24 family protein
MRLIKSNHPSREETLLTPESVFEAKYDWLLRWALHFTQKDRTAAEDLVQDTFVRLMVSWPRIKHTIDEAEPVLYSYLKYAHLTELRRGNRFWRKRSAKSASVLLLRFFHGYFPEEIARIALMKRSVVDKLLSTAREEVKGYLADSGRMQIMHQDRPPEPTPRQIAVPPDLFPEELRTIIFQARRSPCLPAEQLLRRYQAIGPRPIPCELLAHIVSCERCLNTVNSIFDFPSPSQRSQNEALSSARRSKGASGETPPAPKQEILRSIAGAKNRFRRIYEHHPRSLTILVNGDVLAMRDVNSATSELKVQTAPDGPLGIIDVVSEQGLSLLTLYALTVRPKPHPKYDRILN